MIESSTKVLIGQPTPSIRLTIGLVREQLLRRSGVHNPAVVEHDCVAATRCDHAQVLLDQQNGRELRDAFEDAGHLRHEEWCEALGRLVDEQHTIVVQERAADRDHLLLTPGQRSGGLLASLASSGNRS